MYPQYIEPVYRPPSEARSLILQVTNGCSWNNCSFCDMYKAPHKKFKPKAADKIEQELQYIAASMEQSNYMIRRVFLADGDAMALSFRRLKQIMALINQYLPNIQRVSSYCLPRNLKNKTVEELSELQQMGLTLMYIGCESGDNDVLSSIHKGEDYQSTLNALLKIKQSHMKSSVMLINGLGGQHMTEQHALNSAKLMNEAQPEYLSTLVLTLHKGLDYYKQQVGEHYTPLTQLQLFQEMELLMSKLELENTIFRSDHASNSLILKGVLNKDKQQLLKTVQHAIKEPMSLSIPRYTGF